MANVSNVHIRVINAMSMSSIIQIGIHENSTGRFISVFMMAVSSYPPPPLTETELFLVGESNEETAANMVTALLRDCADKPVTAHVDEENPDIVIIEAIDYGYGPFLLEQQSWFEIVSIQSEELPVLYMNLSSIEITQADSADKDTYVKMRFYVEGAIYPVILGGVANKTCHTEDDLYFDFARDQGGTLTIESFGREATHDMPTISKYSFDSVIQSDDLNGLHADVVAPIVFEGSMPTWLWYSIDGITWDLSPHFDNLEDRTYLFRVRDYYGSVKTRSVVVGHVVTNHIFSGSSSPHENIRVLVNPVGMSFPVTITSPINSTTITPADLTFDYPRTGAICRLVDATGRSKEYNLPTISEYRITATQKSSVDNVVVGKIITDKTVREIPIDIQYSRDGLTYGYNNTFINIPAGTWIFWTRDQYGDIQSVPFEVEEIEVGEPTDINESNLDFLVAVGLLRYEVRCINNKAVAIFTDNINEIKL